MRRYIIHGRPNRNAGQCQVPDAWGTTWSSRQRRRYRAKLLPTTAAYSAMSPSSGWLSCVGAASIPGAVSGAR